MEEIDFTKYPDKTYQMEWLETFLRFYYEQIGRNPKEVTDVDVETLYVQVNKFALVSCNGFVLYKNTCQDACHASTRIFVEIKNPSKTSIIFIACLVPFFHTLNQKVPQNKVRRWKFNFH